MTVVELVHRSAAGKVLRVERGIRNTMHASGEEFVLRSLFAGGGLPSNYYLGLDSREEVAVSDVIADIEGLEPTTNGYGRQAVASDGFAIVADSPAVRKANSPSVLFTASGGSWGPVRNIFLCTGLGYGCTLISTAQLGQGLTVSSGEIVFMRMAMSLSGC